MIHMTTPVQQPIHPVEQPTSKDLTQPTHGSIISASRVAGTAVYDLSEQRIGTIEDVMIDKLQGRVDYAVLGFGGFLGMDKKHYPLRWSMLRYNSALEGYQVKLDKTALDNAPTVEEDREWSDDHATRVRAHYDRSLDWPLT
ncbi:PRC-barrel domain-containing protein [Rhodovarius sp.]|jgi:hypothetical protein|uniref:PRC-barrel domain-containing protein n=1 Tax=Rhodovarius sp. TaxID=2972673 RepID=UPI003342D889